jgi:hypothetical protein
MLPRPNPKVVYQVMPDGAVLFSPETEMYFGLNEAGACIWENLPPQQQSFEGLCAAVLARFPDADRGEVCADVEALLSDMQRNGLVLVAH